MQQIQLVDITQIKPYENNPRKNDKAVDKVAESIKEFGFKNPVIVDKDNLIIVGHTRYKAAKKLGLTQIPVIVASDLTPEKAKAYRIADNKTGEIAEWDYEQLINELEELKLSDYDLELTGFDMKEFEDMMEEYHPQEVEDDDFDIDEALEEITEPITQKGDIWLLGRHRLMCGDSTNKDNTLMLMDGKKVNLIVTDPPYNVDYTGKTKDALKIENDKMDNANFYKFLLEAFTRMYEAAADGAAIYVFHADSEGLNFRKAFTEAGFKLAQCCIWAKQSMVMGRQDYHWQHEPVLYGWKPTAAHYWNADRKQTTLWQFDKPFRNDIHPTMKPVPLVAYPIKNSSKMDDVVLDLFGGSGSTLIACEETNRVCRMMELDERYVDVIVKRYIEKTSSDKEVFLLRDGKKYCYKDVSG